MTNNELEKKLTNKILEAFSILRDEDENCRELEMSIKKNSRNSYHVEIHNDAYKNDVVSLLVHKFITEEDLKFKSVDISSSGLFCAAEIMNLFDESAREVINATNEVDAKEESRKLVQITLNAARACLENNLFAALKGGGL